MSQTPIAAPHTVGRIFDTDWSIANVARLLRSNAGRGVWRHAVTTGGSTGSVNRYYLRTVSARHLPSGVSLIFMRVERSEEHTSELQSLRHLVCRLLLEKKNNEIRRGLYERSRSRDGTMVLTATDT